MESPDTRDKYVLSVVICTYNRDKFIATALYCLTLQTLAKEKFEIVIIDNNSTDQTASICKTFVAQHSDFNIRYFLELNKGLSFARNRGISEALSPLITFIDDDAEAVPGFAESIVKFMEKNPGTAGIGGRVVPK
jgi:glucosyl-dolichyl phosphate glucuronosyltransferase